MYRHRPGSYESSLRISFSKTLKKIVFIYFIVTLYSLLSSPFLLSAFFSPTTFPPAFLSYMCTHVYTCVHACVPLILVSSQRCSAHDCNSNDISRRQHVIASDISSLSTASSKSSLGHGGSSLFRAEYSTVTYSPHMDQL